MGVGDRNRVAVGGHSYGAFMTANILAHSNLFKKLAWLKAVPTTAH